MLEYAIVVATRNRVEMLRTTLPLFATQSRPAGQIIVVDRSEDHGAVRDLCADVAQKTGTSISVHYGSEANLPAQRNQGIALVDRPIILFPDDDAVWYPDTAENVMRVYEADTEHRYGAVSAIDVYSGPDDVEVVVARRRVRLTERPAVMMVRNWLEAVLVPQPFEVYGRDRTEQLRPAAQADGLRHPLVGTIGGYRMSFRTEIARRVLFDPVLGSRVGYGIHEDKDMALRVLREGGLIAVASDARVFHNVHPGKRAGGFAYGFFHVLNYAYVCRKVMPDRSKALAVTRRYLRYKLALYSLRRSDEYDRDVYRGAQAAWSTLEEILGADVDGLAQQYALVSDRQK